MTLTPYTWLLHDKGKIGSRHQCIGLAEALGLTYDTKEVHIPNFYTMLPWVWYERLTKSDLLFRQHGLAKPWPDLVIASGRKAVQMAARLKKLHPSTCVVILQKPQQNLSNFDLVLCPQHDMCLQKQNVIETMGSIHHLTTSKLSASHALHPVAPGVVVLIGAPPQDQKTLDMMMPWLKRWETHAHHHHQDFYIIASRRTPESVIHALRSLTHPRTHIWDPSSSAPNPYLSALSCATKIVVTGDSVNMLTESCFTGCPVYIWSLASYRRKFKAFHQSLIDAGHARWADPCLESFKAHPLREIERIKPQILSHLSMVGAAGFEPTTLTPPA